MEFFWWNITNFFNNERNWTKNLPLKQLKGASNSFLVFSLFEWTVWKCGRCCMKLNSNNLVLRESGSEYSIKTFAFLMRPLADAQPQWNIFCFSYCINHETWQTKAKFLISIILDVKRGKIVKRNQYLGYTRGTLVE